VNRKEMQEAGGRRWAQARYLSHLDSADRKGSGSGKARKAKEKTIRLEKGARNTENWRIEGKRVQRDIERTNTLGGTGDKSSKAGMLRSMGKKPVEISISIGEKKLGRKPAYRRKRLKGLIRVRSGVFDERRRKGRLGT